MFHNSYHLEIHATELGGSVPKLQLLKIFFQSYLYT